MPNHVTTILKAPAEVIDSLYLDGELDFNTVIPMPDNDDPIFTATYTEFAPGFGGWSFDGYSPLEWARANWGTKWNAYDIERRSDDVVKFDTAWSHPDPVIEALSKRFPKVEIHVEYADEDLGNNLGVYAITNGEAIELMPPLEPYSDEARDFASRLVYGKSYAELREEWGYDDEDDDE